MTSPECPHQWQRLPVTDFTAVYRCKDCGHAVQVSVSAMLSRTLDDLDIAFQQEHGGTVIEPDEPLSSLPPDPFARNQESAVGLHEGYLWLRSGGFSMAEALIYLAANTALNTMIAVQEAALAAQHETPETPGDE